MRPSGSDLAKDRLLLAAVLAATLLVYLPTLRYPFAADDASQILGNPRIHSWQYVPEYFRSHVWAHLGLSDGARGAAYYRPLFLLWELVVWQIFGSSAAGWHLSAVMLHVAVTAMVFLLTRRITGESGVAGLASLLFGLYPIHVESVTWISGATEPLAALPFLGAMLCWIRAADSARAGWWRTGSVALYAAALLAKETTIVLPGVIVAYELLVRRKTRLPWLPLAGFLAVAAAYMAVRQVTLQGTAHTDIPFSVLLLTWPSVLWFYVKQSALPVGLTLIYDLPLIHSFSWRTVALPGVLFAGALGIALAYARGRRVASFALAWAALSLLPPLYLRAFTPVEIVHDRYLYLPSVGICLILAGIIPLRSRLGLGAAGLAAAIFAGITIVECVPWSDEVRLFRRAIEVSPMSWHARRQLAFALQRNQRCDEAMPLLAAILDGTPDDRVTAFALGACYFHKGQFSEAKRLMEQTVEQHPTYQQPYLLLATILLGEHRVDEAEQLWIRSRDLRVAGPAEPTFHLVRAEILRARGDLRGAVAEYRKELELQPGNQEITDSMLSAEAQQAATLP